MCERCQTKLNFISRKLCNGCSRYFCHQCMSHGHGVVGGGGGEEGRRGESGARGSGEGGLLGTGGHSSRKSPQFCRRCTVFNYPVMERRHLHELSLQELKGYQGIQAPLNADKDLLVQMILGHQARVLTERAQKAVQQISHAHRAEDVLSVDPRTLEPPTTAYSCSSSSSSRLNQSLPGSTAQSTSMDIRSRVRAHIQLRKSTEVLDTSGISRVEELSDESQIDLLSVRQLKTILQRNCIDYRGCVEKSELMERVHRLYQDKLDQKELEAKIIAGGDTEAENEYLCKVCMDSAVDCVFLDCGHMLTCVKCGRQLSECPVCRQYIVKVIHTFRV